MNNLVVAVARETKLFAGLESAPNVQMLPTDSGMNLIVTSGAGSIQQNIRQIDDPQYRNTRSVLDPIIGSFDVGKWAFPALIKTIAAAGTPAEPELDPVFVALFGKPADTSQTAWFGANSRAYLLKGVDSSGTIYPSLTLWFKVGHFMYYACGVTVNTGEFNIAGNDLCKCNFSGEFSRHGFAGVDAVAAADGGSGTSLVVEDARKFFIAATGDVLPIVFVHPTTGADEASATVTAINYDTNTLTLQAGASRTVGHLVAPRLPAGTEVGTPLYGKYGITRIGGTPSTKSAAGLPVTPMIVQSCRFTITNGIRYHADLKDGTLYASEFVAPAKRTAEGEITSFLYRDMPVFMYKALRDPLYEDYVILPMQDRLATTGRIAEVHCPRVIWGSPNVAGEDEKTVTLPFKAVGSPSYDDEAALVFAPAPTSAVATTTTTTT